jgi:hypothetical protein
LADHATSLLVEIVGTTATRLANSRIEPDRLVRTCREVRRMQRLRLNERGTGPIPFGCRSIIPTTKAIGNPPRQLRIFVTW